MYHGALNSRRQRCGIRIPLALVTLALARSATRICANRHGRSVITDRFREEESRARQKRAR
eukprot:9488556-Pyramimonas_sp.AAC.2